jgi:uncharacterized protein (TIGR04255 family)
MVQSVGPQSTKLKNAPLVHVLAQVKFAPFLPMGEAIPSIQNGLKKLGFPRFDKSQVQTLTITPPGPPRIEHADRWDFLNREKQTGVVLTSSFVVLQTSQYETFSVFGRLLREVLRTLGEEAEIEIVERIGVRYVDLIKPLSGEVYTKYLQPGLAGFPFEGLNDPLLSRSFSNIQSMAETTDKRKIVVRCFPTNTGEFLPPDLNPTGLTYSVDLNAGQMAAILDFDHYADVDIDFDADDLVKRIDNLHKVANSAFRVARSKHAHKIWSGEE